MASSSIFKGNFSPYIISKSLNLDVGIVCLGLLELFVRDLAAENNGMKFILERENFRGVRLDFELLLLFGLRIFLKVVVRLGLVDMEGLVEIISLISELLSVSDLPGGKHDVIESETCTAARDVSSDSEQLPSDTAGGKGNELE